MARCSNQTKRAVSLRAKATWLVALSVFTILQIGLVQAGASTTQSSEGPKKPLPIVQGPWQTFSSPAADPSPCTLPFCYWFQVGAQGNSATSNSVGVNVTIRTVFDKVNQDAHSYWVGSILANNAFVQAGYLNGLSTNNQPYCCAWFYEFFPAGNNNSPPVIGPEGSAGPIGSWHSYSMIHVGNGVWHFYMDGNYLGSTPSPGQPNYLGLGATSTSSNSFPAAIAEVAQASTNLDVIGPAEFKNLNYTTGSGWQPVQVGVAHIGYGATSLTSLPNPYGVAEIYNTSDDFLAGSNIPQPAKNSQLWPTIPSPPLSPQLSFTFLDMDGGQIQPTWISLKDGNNLIFYSNYQNQIVPTPNSGNYTVYQAIWHAVNVTTGLRFLPSGSVQSIPVNVFSVSLQVVGLFYSIAVSGATIQASLPDSTSETVTTDDGGHAVLTQLPPSTYALHTAVPHSIAATSSQSIQGPSSIVLKVFSLLELVTVIVAAVILALGAVALAWRKERARQMAVPPIAAPGFVSTNCTRCGQPLPGGVNFCPNCGTPLRTTIS